MLIKIPHMLLPALSCHRLYKNVPDHLFKCSFCQQEHSWEDDVTVSDGQRDQWLIMAAVFLLLPAFLLSLFQSSGAQTIIGLSPSFDHQEPAVNPLPDSTKQTVLLWPSLPPRGRSDVPIRPTLKDKLANTRQVGQRLPTAPSPPSVISALSSHNLSGGPVATQPPSSRARTDTARLAFLGRLSKLDATSKGLTPPQPTLSSSPRTENQGEEEVGDGEGDIFQDLGSGNIPTEDETLPYLPAFGDEMAQYQQSAQTTISVVSDLQPPAENQTPRPPLFPLTTTNKISTTPSDKVRATAPPVAAPTTIYMAGKKTNI